MRDRRVLHIFEILPETFRDKLTSGENMVAAARIGNRNALHWIKSCSAVTRSAESRQWAPIRLLHMHTLQCLETIRFSVCRLFEPQHDKLLYEKNCDRPIARVRGIWTLSKLLWLMPWVGL